MFGLTSNPIQARPSTDSIAIRAVDFNESEQEQILQQLFLLCSNTSGDKKVKQMEPKFKSLLDRLCEINPDLINTQDYQGKTLLMHSIINEHFQFTNTLLACDSIDIDKRTNQTQQTALMFAIEKAFISTVLQLLNENNVTDCDASGKSLLMYAVDNFSIIQAILKSKSALDLNQQDNEGRSFLMFALKKMAKNRKSFVTNASLKLVVNAMLAESSVNFLLRDKAGKSMQDYAEEAGDPDIIRIICEKMKEESIVNNNV